MRNIRLTIEYDGTAYHGWQYQPNRKTVQGEIEKALKRLFGVRVRVAGAGRTDAGVHALGQVASFKIESKMPARSLKDALNGNLPRDILVKAAAPAADDFHARYDARSKVYEYTIWLGRSPIRRGYVWELKYRLDLILVKRGLAEFLGRHDFTNFSVAREKEDRVCNITKTVLKRRGKEIVLQIEGDRFLHKMVRMMVGFVVDIGRGRLGPEIAREMFKANFKKNYLVAPPQGLNLVRVKYD